MRRLTEGDIARAVGLQLLKNRCVLLVDRCSWTGYECDVLGITNDLRVIDVEIKVSRADLRADRAKDKWWQQPSWWHCDEKPPRVALPWPRKVWKQYFAVPESVWSDELLADLPSSSCGVVLCNDDPKGMWTRCVRRAKPNPSAERLTPAQVMAVTRLANLRMWSAYEARDQAVANMRIAA